MNDNQTNRESDSWQESPKESRGGRDLNETRQDEDLRLNIMEALYQHHELDTTRVNVFVEGGYVTLKGSVETIADKKMVESLIFPIQGVRDVFNLLEEQITPEPWARSRRIGDVGNENRTKGLY